MNRIVFLNWFRPEKQYTAREISPMVQAIQKAFRMEKHGLELTDNIDAALDAAF